MLRHTSYKTRKAILHPGAAYNKALRQKKSASYPLLHTRHTRLASIAIAGMGESMAPLPSRYKGQANVALLDC